MSSTWRQLRALVGLRWRMVRSRRQRGGLLVLAFAVLAFVVAAVAGGRLAPEQRFFNAAILTPTAFVVYAVLSLIGPLAAGGGNELFPSDELVPHPVRPATIFLASLLLAPLNIAWVAQTTALLSLTSYVAGRWAGVPAALTVTALYVLAATVCGQALAWGMSGVRQTRWGRRLSWALIAAAAAAVVVVMRAGLTDVLDRAPTRWVVVAMLQGAGGHLHQWAEALLLLSALVVLGVLAGARTTAYAVHRPPGTVAERQARNVARHPDRRSALAQLRAIDRAGVWRAPALRRGVLVMGLLPGAAAAAGRVEWSALALTAGLVAAGAGLLFGVNAFCLDAGGALWLGSQPLSATDHLRAKAWTIIEVCLVCSTITALAGASRARGPLDLTGVLTVVAAVSACTAVVVAACLRSSVTRPHRAELRGPRDTPAPPGAMAVHSARLAFQTTMVGLLVTAAGASGRPLAPLLATGAVVALAAVSASRTAGLYADPAIRANVTITVATG